MKKYIYTSRWVDKPEELLDLGNKLADLFVTSNIHEYLSEDEMDQIAEVSDMLKDVAKLMREK